MTGGSMLNYYVFSFVLSAFCLTLMVLGFTIVGSPTEQKGAVLDDIRLDNFASIHDQMLVYYQKKYTFPKYLTELTENEGQKEELILHDPETKKPYTYQPLNLYQYNLCTEFSTDTTDKKAGNTNGSLYGYNLEQDAKDLTHTKGEDCITINIPSTYTSLKYSYTSFTDSDVPPGRLSQPTASLKFLDKTSDCEWYAGILLQGFTPDTKFYVKSEGKLSDQCDPAKTHPYSWDAGPGGQADSDGNTIFIYNQKDYGDYTYTVTDLSGKTAAVHFRYGKDDTAPTILSVTTKASGSASFTPPGSTLLPTPTSPFKAL